MDGIKRIKPICLIFLVIGILLFSCKGLTDSLTAEEHFYRGANFYLDGDLDGAILELKSALEIDPKCKKAHRLLKVILEEKAKLEEVTIKEEGAQKIILGEKAKPEEVTIKEEGAQAPKIAEAKRAREESSTSKSPAEYIIGIEDVLSISIWPSEDFPKEVTVRIDGNISFPLIGKIKADGLTPSLLEKEMEKRLSEYIKNPWVTVMVKEYNSKKVMLLGEISGGPKIYPLTKRVKVLELLILLGGLTDKADISKIKVTREDGEIVYVNLNNILYSQKTEDSLPRFAERGRGGQKTEEREKRAEADDENIVIKPGDTIFIPKITKEKVFVLGAVNKPGMVYIEKERLTVFEAIAEAGTLSAGAEASSVKVIRGDIKNPQIIRVNLDEVVHKGDLKGNITLKPDDIVYVPGERKAFIDQVNKVIGQITPSLGLIYLQPFLKKLAE